MAYLNVMPSRKSDVFHSMRQYYSVISVIVVRTEQELLPLVALKMM